MSKHPISRTLAASAIAELSLYTVARFVAPQKRLVAALSNWKTLSDRLNKMPLNGSGAAPVVGEIVALLLKMKADFEDVAGGASSLATECSKMSAKLDDSLKEES
jgi:hypothetical protein